MTLKKGKPGWRDVKGALVDFDRAGLLALVQDMYAASKDNQVFLHARFGLGEDALEPYRVVIERWLCPDVYKNQDYSVAKAKKPIADYKKAIGLPTGLACLDGLASQDTAACPASTEILVVDAGSHDGTGRRQRRHRQAARGHCPGSGGAAAGGLNSVRRAPRRPGRHGAGLRGPLARALRGGACSVDAANASGVRPPGRGHQ